MIMGHFGQHLAVLTHDHGKSDPRALLRFLALGMCAQAPNASAALQQGRQPRRTQGRTSKAQTVTLREALGGVPGPPLAQTRML